MRPLTRGGRIAISPGVLYNWLACDREVDEPAQRRTLMENSSRDSRKPASESKTAIRRPGPNIWVLLVIVGVMAMALFFTQGPRRSTIPYSFFLEQIQQGNVLYVQLGDQEASGLFQEPPPEPTWFDREGKLTTGDPKKKLQQALSGRVAARRRVAGEVDGAVERQGNQVRERSRPATRC